MLVWLTNYALHLIDDAANGVRESKAASVEMLANPYLDSRCWIHPLAAVALGCLHYFHPAWPAWPTLLIVTLLFPASISACVMSGRARDAFSPLMMWRVVEGLGFWYPLLVAFISICAMIGVLLARQLQLGAILIASEQLLLLIAYAGMGGVLYERRIELAFEPRLSPEREADRIGVELSAKRQHFLDELYNDLRLHESKRAAAKAKQWFEETGQDELPVDVHAILEAGKSWTKLRDYPRLLQGLIPILLGLKQPALAYTLCEAGLSLDANFSAAEESDSIALASYALATGRRRAAERLLENYLRGAGATREPGPQLAALRARLQPPGLILNPSR